MPYLEPARKNAIDTKLVDPSSPGDLNYVFTTILLKYIDTCGLSYQTINDIVGALEGCKLEFYRRLAVGYEVKKILKNGDVYTTTGPNE